MDKKRGLKNSMDKGMASLLPGEVHHTLSKSEDSAAASSAAQQLIKMGRSILADTVAVETSTSQIAQRLVNSSW